MSSDHPLPDIAERLWDLSHRFKARLRASLTDGAPALSQDLAPFQAKALSAIGRYPGLLPNQLADRSGRDKAQIARVLKDLEERGLIARSPHPTDRRTHCLSLTPAGETVFQHLQRSRVQIARQMMDGLTPAEQQQISALLARMADNLALSDTPG